MEYRRYCGRPTAFDAVEAGIPRRSGSVDGKLQYVMQMIVLRIKKSYEATSNRRCAADMHVHLENAEAKVYNDPANLQDYVTLFCLP